jgi:phasin family protein
MSQKPKAGTPARTASANKAAPKEVAAPADPAAAEPDAKADPVVAETVEAAPAVAAPSAPEAEVEATVVPSYSVNETISAGSDFAAASAIAASATFKATADTVAAVTSEVVETTSSIEPTQPTITQGIKSMMKTTEDFVAFGQANLEAFVKSGQIWSAGVQELTKQIASSAKASFDESVSTFKAMSTAKSVKEAMDLQSNFAKAALEKAMAESNKLTDASIKLTEQTLAPITARVTVAVETFGKAA